MSYNCSTQASCKHYPAAEQCEMCFNANRICYCRDVLSYDYIAELEILEQNDAEYKKFMTIYPRLEKNSSGNNTTTAATFIKFLEDVRHPSEYNSINVNGNTKTITQLLLDVKSEYNTRWCHFDEIDEISKEYKVNEQLKIWGVGTMENEVNSFYEKYQLHNKRFQSTNSRVQKDKFFIDYYISDMNNVDFHGKKTMRIKICLYASLGLMVGQK